jgi:thiopurine S-methyltransferase
MKNDFWLEKWKVNQIGFHQEEIHPFLYEEWDDFFSKVDLTPLTIFVPLCGKSSDMVFLSKKCKHLFGCELSEIACRDFFTENNIDFNEKTEGDFTVFSGSNISLYCGDIFNLPDTIEVDIIYDRASLIALPTDIRLKYVEKIKELKASYQFIITLEFDNSQIGPPFSIDDSNIQDYYASTYEISHRKRLEMPVEDRFENVSFMFGNLFCLS